MKKLKNVHPGEVLEEEYMKPLALSGYQIAKETGLSATAVSEICRGLRRVTADTAFIFGKYLGTSAEFWMGLQADYDLAEAHEGVEKKLKKIKPLVHAPTP